MTRGAQAEQEREGGRVRTAKSAYKSAFLGTLRSAFTRKSAFQSAQKSAKNSVAPKRVL